jgi:hypothetical protein
MELTPALFAKHKSKLKTESTETFEIIAREWHGKIYTNLEFKNTLKLITDWNAMFSLIGGKANQRD